MNTVTRITLGMIFTVAAIPLLIYSFSPSSINMGTSKIVTIAIAASSDPQTFMNMTEVERFQAAANMSQEENQMIMNEFSKQNVIIDENMSLPVNPEDTNKSIAGNFMSAGDGFHHVEGVAKVINLQDGRNLLRLENLKSTNGPDLYVYLSTDRGVSDFVNLGRLKGNIGNQNYEVPAGTDLTKYDTVLIWCRAFSTLFGSANLST